MNAVAGRFFISYEHTDKPAADRICHALETNGILCWIAPRDVVAGSIWATSIVEAIEQAVALVLVFSANSDQSQQVPRELELAVRCGVPIIPVRIELAEPKKAILYFIGSINWLDAFERSLESHLPHLVAHAKSLLDGQKIIEEQAEKLPSKGQTSAARPLWEFLDQVSLQMDRVRSNAAPVADEAARLIRSQFLSRLPGMDCEQKGIAVRSLYLAGLIQSSTPRIDLSGADLSGVNLLGAFLPSANLGNADLSKADLRHMNLANGTLWGANINGVRLEGARLDNVRIYGCEIEAANLDVGFLRSLGADPRRPD